MGRKRQPHNNQGDDRIRDAIAHLEGGNPRKCLRVLYEVLGEEKSGKRIKPSTANAFSEDFVTLIKKHSLPADMVGFIMVRDTMADYFAGHTGRPYQLGGGSVATRFLERILRPIEEGKLRHQIDEMRSSTRSGWLTQDEGVE